MIISVDSPNYLNSNEEQSVNKVCVRNGLGQPLKGKMKVLVSYFKFNWERLQMLNEITSPYDLREFDVNFLDKNEPKLTLFKN